MYGLLHTPSRVVESYKSLFSGYDADIGKILDKKFHEISDFDGIVILKAVKFSSFCEHHILPFFGTVDIAYIPNGFVIGVSKLARLVEALSRRLQIQEGLTAQIANALDEYLAPLGVAVRVSASHTCMTLRGVMAQGSLMDTTHFIGDFKHNNNRAFEFYSLIK